MKHLNSIFLCLAVLKHNIIEIGADDTRYARFIAQSYGKNLTQFAQERGIKEFQKNFDRFMTEFEKHYNTDLESDYRAGKFLYNLEFVQRQNSYYERRRVPFRLRINQFADEDMNDNTVRRQKTFVSLPSQLSDKNVIEDGDNGVFDGRSELDQQITGGQSVGDTGPFPTEFDWRQRSILTPIKNQGNCGSCWAIATISIVESVNALANNSLRVASSEQVMDCVRPPAFQSRGCDGGAPLEAFDFVQRFGVASSAKYMTERASTGSSSTSSFPSSSSLPSSPSLGILGTCHDVTLPADKLWIDFYRLGRRLSDRRIMELVQRNGPIAALINAGDEDFTFYGEGVITSYGDTRFDTPYNHLVNIVGWGNDNGLDYWLIRNSWSPAWGELGYGRLLRGINNRGINNFIIYAGASKRSMPDQPERPPVQPTPAPLSPPLTPTIEPRPQPVEPNRPSGADSFINICHFTMLLSSMFVSFFVYFVTL